MESKSINMIDKSKFTTISSSEGKKFRAMFREAASFLTAQRWCKSVKQGWLSLGWEDILAVFFVEIVPTTGSGADSGLWVIVGDKSCPSDRCICQSDAAMGRHS